MKLRDHSTKAHRSYSEIERRGGEDAVRAAVIAARFPAEAVEWVPSKIIWLAQRYRGDVDSRDQRPRPKAVRASLRAVLTRGRAFEEALNCLSFPTRIAISDADTLRHPDQAEADSFRLAKDLEYFLSCARFMLFSTPKDKGAPQPESAHVNFALNLAAIWRLCFSASGITKRGATGTYQGPLLDFAEAILKLEGAAYRNGPAFRTRLALAKSLHKHRKRAAEVAEQMRARMSAVPKGQ